MAFPATRLGVTVEAAFGHADHDTALLWEWVDLTDRLFAQQISIRRGRDNETSDTPPSSMGVLLDNRDGALMPGNALSPWWPNVRRGTPIRVCAEGATPAMVLRRLGDHATTPSHPDFDFAGPFDLRVLVDPDQWVDRIDGIESTFLPAQPIIDRWGGGGDRSWMWLITSTGRRWVRLSTDGTDVVDGFTNRVDAAQHPLWMGVTVTPNNGAGGWTMSAYRWDGYPSSPPADITDWGLVESVTVDGPVSVHHPARRVRIGGEAFGTQFLGRVLRAEIRDGINGTMVADPDFTAATPGATEVVDSTGKPWVLGGGAEISTMRARFAGTIDAFEPLWPYGDHAQSADNPTESWMRLTAAGPLRRLTQGADPLRSTLHRAVNSPQHESGVVAYWSCEEGAAAARLGSSTPGVGPMTVTGARTAADSSLPASGPLPTVQAGDVAMWSGTVPTGTQSGDQWAVDFVFRLTEDPGGLVPVVTVSTGGTAATWRVEVSNNLRRVSAVDAGAGSVVDLLEAFTPGDLIDRWILTRLAATNVGPNVEWECRMIDLDAGAGSPTAGSFAGTAGVVTGVANQVTGPPGGLSFGHYVVTDGTIGSSWLAGADTAWVGESAAHRFWRLAQEEGVPVEIVGDPTLVEHFRGSLALTEPMGPQTQLPLAELLRECVRADLAVLDERRAVPGLTFRCRHTLEGQDPSVTLSGASAGQIVVPFEPALDDQRLRNDVTVTAAAGSSARAVDGESVAVEGRYAVDETLNLVGGVEVQAAILAAQEGLAAAVGGQNTQHAWWMLHVGTWPDMRYPTVATDLTVAPEVAAAWHDAALGDRVTVSDLPAQHPAGSVELVVESITEDLTPTRWHVTATCSPAGPWDVGVLDE